MTIRQLYYTSCQHGREGIEGFQINAASPGLAERHEDLGLRLSAYRPGPSTPALPTPEQIAEFPVSVGYRSFDDVAVIFHSRYVGTDFTGRQGNYFAHILVLDEPDRDLAGMLPVEAWGSQLWCWQPSATTDLPLVDTVPRGSLTDHERIRAHLQKGRLPAFGLLLTAVQEGLAGRISRVIVVAPNAGDVAHAIAAVTRALPAPLAADVSFTTFASAPAEVDVLVAGTTPDVPLTHSPYDDHQVVNWGGDSAVTGRVSHYAALLSECWKRGVSAVGDVHELAALAVPALRADELEQFADLAELVLPGLSGSARTPLPALELAVRRLPSVLTPDLWEQVDDRIRRTGSIDDVERWSEVLAAASRQGAMPGTELESAYLRALLSRVVSGALDPADRWLPARAGGRLEKLVRQWATDTLAAAPMLATAAGVLGAVTRLRVRLTDDQLRSLADLVVLPQLFNLSTAADVAMLTTLPESDRLLVLVCDQLDGRLATDDLFDAAVEELPPAAADLLMARAPRGSRCALAAAIARARAARTERVPTLLTAVKAGGGRSMTPGAIERFAALLWPDLPSAAEGVQLCRHVDAAVLGATTIPQRLVERLIEDAEGAGFTPDHGRLADLLADDPLARSLASGVQTVDAVRWGAYFSGGPSASEEEVVEGVRSATAVPIAVRNWVLSAVADWMLSRADTTLHADCLRRIVRDGECPEFLDVYRLQVTGVLKSAKPFTIACVLPAVASLAAVCPEGRQLLDTACREALDRRGRRDLDAVGDALRARERQYPMPTLGRRGPKSWQSWWEVWRERNLSRSLLTRVLRRRAKGGED